MSGIICTCDSPVKNLGLPNCTDLIGIPRRLIFVPTFQNDGTLNYIETVGTTFNAAFWNALQYNTDTTARYYPLAKDFEEVAMSKADTVYQEFASGNMELVKDGVRSFEGMLPKTAIPLIGKLKSKGCAKHSVYIIDHLGNIIGVEKTLGKLYPMQLNDNTLNSIFQFATDTTVPMIQVKFQFAQSIADEQISFIKSSDLGIDMFTQFNGKTDSNIVQVGTGTTTTVVVDVYTDYGSAKNKIPVEGLVLADFVLYNVTDSATITPSSVVEDSVVPGRYTFTFTAETATDILRLTLSTSEAAKPYDDGTWPDVQLTLQ